MAASKTLFNSSAKQCAVELVERRFGVTLDVAQLDITLQPTATHVTVNFQQKESITQGARYVGLASIAIEKLDVTKHLPNNMVYADVWPVSFESFASNMLANYGLLFESGDFGLVTSGGVVPMVHGATLNATLDANQQVTLISLETSGRWKAGQTIKMFVLYSQLYLDRLVLTGDAPNAIAGADYSYAYQVLGGQPPYELFVISGEIPYSFEENSTVLNGLTPPSGQFRWKVGVRDSAGREAELEDSLEVVAGDISFSNATHLVTNLGDQIDFWFTTIGGSAPKRYVLTQPVPGVTLAENGHLTGDLLTGTHVIEVRCTDAANTAITMSLTVIVEEPEQELLRYQLGQKLNGGHWYEFMAGRTDLGAYRVKDRLSGNDLLWTITHLLTSQIDPTLGGDAIASLKFFESGLTTEADFVPLTEDFTIHLRFRGPVDQPGAFLFGTWDDLNGWAVRINATGTGIEFVAKTAQRTVTYSSDEGVSEFSRSSLTISKVGRHLWIQANGRLKYFTLPPRLAILETSGSHLAVGAQYNGGGIAYSGAFERAVLLRQGIRPDEIGILTDQGHGFTLDRLQTELDLLELVPFPPQSLECPLPPGSSVYTGSFDVNGGVSPMRALYFLDDVLTTGCGYVIDSQNSRRFHLTLPLLQRAEKTTYVAVEDADGRLTRIRIDIKAP